MKENVLDPVELSADQRRIFIDTCQLYEVHEDACGRNESFRSRL